MDTRTRLRYLRAYLDGLADAGLLKATDATCLLFVRVDDDRRLLASQELLAGDDVLSLWTVCEHPSDYPDDFVARRWDVRPGVGLRRTADVRRGPTLEAVRNQLPPGLYCQPRQCDDDSVIVETWL